ncbi:hypothetical protein GPJ56_005900 [Histomonas meleagridis]|uniref:uncharacterized protein n=1 Tax=Histomonas meleagridis TaxID=135588 RepID=UPI003559769B|nr:hypothetical protein GPJ56_005900 [Histomonas meleagridis]KAH0801916.1 hypothetical protein GO595_005334 [Histomonas meleagridis]
MADEAGVDAGGPGREVVAELAADLCCPNCGLFIPVPNARNGIGENREFVIPIPDPRHLNVLKKYKFAGVLLGMCIRTSLVQDFNFAPLVWDYLADGYIAIEQIYAIDVNFKALIESLQEALNSGISEIEFNQRFKLNFVVNDSNGNEVPLVQRGRLEVVTLSNCAEFIELAKAFRLNEMKSYLDAMKEGLWENLDFETPAFITGDLLELCACGSNQITAEKLKQVIVYNGVPQNMKNIMNFVIDHLTSEERSKLIKFSTGRTRLPPDFGNSHFYLNIDYDGSSSRVDNLPTASTCFNQLHIPSYTSNQKALAMIKVAIEFTGTFENT